MSELQSEASRLNGAQSHGPCTPEGKAISSQNSLQDGFYAVKSILIKGEIQEEYDRHCARIRAAWDPKTGHEEVQVDDLCRIQWKILRCDRKEAEAEDAEVPDQQRLDKLSLHRARLERSKVQVLHELRLSISERQKECVSEMEQAVAIRRADLLAGRPTVDLKSIGFRFVSSVEEVDKEIAYQTLYFRAESELQTRKAA